jgi:kynurenine formamidase
VRPVGGQALPGYRQLPVLGDAGDVRHAWHVWGEADRLGTMNRLTDATVLRALAVPRTGRRVNLSLPLGLPQPTLYDRTPMSHTVFDRNRNMVEDTITSLDPQASSQWDSLRHIRAGRHGHYGGIAGGDPRAAQLGIDTLARHGLLARGVLLDVAGYHTKAGRAVDPFEERPITVDELQAVARSQDVRLRPADLLLVRTGWLSAYRDAPGLAPDYPRMPRCTGLHAGARMAQFLWDQGFCAVATDNPAVEVLPGDPAIGSLHRRLIAGLGMPLGELWDLDGLAAACAAEGRYECCVLSVPLNVPGGVASPANAMAIL